MAKIAEKYVSRKVKSDYNYQFSDVGFFYKILENYKYMGNIRVLGIIDTSITRQTVLGHISDRENRVRNM